MTPDRITSLEPELRALTERGVAVSVVTKQLEERDKNFRAGHAQMEQALRDWGVLIVHKRAMHEKLVIVDRRVVWIGSLNPLSFKNTQEIMLRRDGKDVAEEIEKLLMIDDLLQPVRDGETECPYCGSEVVAAEGGHDLFYWRCVQEDCFTRSVGDPMPKDGLVVCRSGGCGASVHFGHWGERPAWRCGVSHLHRTPITRSHSRLPKMRALIPAPELRKLEREWGVTDEQLRLSPDAASGQKAPASTSSGPGTHEAVAAGTATEENESPARAVSASPTSSAARGSASAGGHTTARESRGTVEIGFINKNRQQVFAATDLPGSDHGQRIYVLCCRYCGTDYGSNGSDIFQRKCPNCQDGRPGLKYK